jgi:tetratricopeptide (TPR) repeat protein
VIQQLENKKRFSITCRCVLTTAFIFLSVFISSCVSQEQSEYTKGRKQLEEGNFRLALFHFDRVMKRSPENRLALWSAREGYRITYFEIKDYKRAIQYSKFLILKSPDSAERTKSQLALAAIYFDHLQDYPQALLEYGKLLSLSLTNAERMKVKLSIASAYYHLNEFDQAKSEIREILKSELSEDIRFNVLILDTNILVSEKNWLKAIENYKKLAEDFPDKAVSENILLNLSASYEEVAKFKEAVEVLEKLKKIHPEPDYIDLKINKTLQRSKNAPGAKGFRK